MQNDPDLTFTKRPAQPLAARAEAAGLRWLREASDTVVEVYEVSDHHLVIERVHTVRPTPEAARQAGRELARVHAAGAPAFGAPPAGWDGPNFIGSLEQECTPTENWGYFYTQQRVLPFARKAAKKGTIGARTLDAVEAACERIEAAIWDITPARIHGDLWAGNLLFGERGPAFIDPAAHGGHPETDLAMLDLFGAPYLAEIIEGYTDAASLSQDFAERIPLHQLHPLAVHAFSHGSAYEAPLADAARRTLA